MSVNYEAAINRVFQEFRTDIIAAFNEAPRVWMKYAMVIPSSSRSTLHAWLANQAAVREWIGPRRAKSMGTRHWEVTNRQFELTYEFEVNQLRDDLSGLAAQAVAQARQMGVKFARHEDLLVAQTLEAGLTALCYDGQYFFDTDHPVDLEGITSGTFANSLPSSALTHKNFDTAYTKLHQFKLEDGSPMVPPGTKLNLIVPPALRNKAEQILIVKNLTPAAAIDLFNTTGASDNPLVGKAEIIENAYLTSDTRWYLTVDDGYMKPLMLQQRQGLEMMEQGIGSPIYFAEKKIQIGGDARYEASYTLPQLAITGAP